MNKSASVPWNQKRENLLQNPEVAAAYEEFAPEYEIARQLIKARLERGMTQEQLAAKVGTRQSNISRLERGQQNVSVGLLNKVAKGLGKTLHVTIG